MATLQQQASLASLAQTPEGQAQLAEALASRGVQPESVFSFNAPPGASGLGADVLPQPTLTSSLPQVAQPPAAATPELVAPPPATAPAPDTAGNLLTALQGIQAPAAPVTPTLPRGTAPLPRGGGTVNPQLLEQIRAILAPPAQPQISSLGGLIAGTR